MTSDRKLVPRITHPADQEDRYFKPEGLWYAMGLAWVKWCVSEMEHWVDGYTYTFELAKNNNMLFLQTPGAIQEFARDYAYVYDYGVIKIHNINWKRVNQDYDGVEFVPYFRELRFGHDFMWYNGIDVPSGVIFNANIITNIKRHFTKSLLT